MNNNVAYRPNQWIRAGLLSRGDIRLSLAQAGIEFIETKSLTSSVFQVKVSPRHWDSIVETLQGAYNE